MSFRPRLQFTLILTVGLREILYDKMCFAPGSRVFEITLICLWIEDPKFSNRSWVSDEQDFYSDLSKSFKICIRKVDTWTPVWNYWNDLLHELHDQTNFNESLWRKFNDFFNRNRTEIFSQNLSNRTRVFERPGLKKSTVVNCKT
jgi:hypothetical protein